LPRLTLSCYSIGVTDSERRPTDAEVSASALRRLAQALRDHLALSRFHAKVGIV